MWRNVEKLSCGEMFPHDIFLLMSNEKCAAQFTLFSRKICLVAIYALLCGEKLNWKLCLWRKKDKYQVCVRLKIPDMFFDQCFLITLCTLHSRMSPWLQFPSTAFHSESDVRSYHSRSRIPHSRLSPDCFKFPVLHFLSFGMVAFWSHFHICNMVRDMVHVLLNSAFACTFCSPVLS